MLLDLNLVFCFFELFISQLIRPVVRNAASAIMLTFPPVVWDYKVVCIACFEPIIFSIFTVINSLPYHQGYLLSEIAKL